MRESKLHVVAAILAVREALVDLLDEMPSVARAYSGSLSHLLYCSGLVWSAYSKLGCRM